MKSIILFDMDGTLTLPRQKIERDMVEALKKVSKDFDIGIVTGSDYDYVIQQCKDVFSLSGLAPEKLYIFPCNGTKKYEWKYTKYELTYEVDMIEKIGKSSYKKLLSKLFDFQSEILLFYPTMALTGTFFHYRGSMLNWCPIGRIANLDQRNYWKKLDKDFSIRKEYVEILNDYINKQNIPATVVLGGSTSFDIYPSGWDKTYVMQHLEGYENVHFIGDMCEPGGNDQTLYTLLATDGNSYKTSGPEETLAIISKLHV